MLRCLFLSVVCLACVTPSPAQDASTKPEISAAQTHARQPESFGRITGSIVCADTHRPARGAIVTANSIGGGTEDRPVSRKAQAQLDGTYSIDHLPPGTYIVLAFLPGYSLPFDDETLNQMHSDKPEVQAGLRRNGVAEVTANGSAHFDISLVRGAAVSGRVLYSDGSPASQVAISVENTKHDLNFGQTVGLDVMEDGILRSVYLRQSFNTDDHGSFRIAGLSPGEYRIAAVQPSLQDSGGVPDSLEMLGLFVTHFVPLRIYSGDTMHRALAKKYQLRAGDELTGVEITIPLEAFHHLHGLLHAIDGRPLNEAYLTLTDTADDNLKLDAKLHRDGTFDFPLVPSGTYSLKIENAGIGLAPAGFENEPSVALRTTNTFSSTTTTVLVKDSDITDIDVPMKEVPPAK